MTLQYWLVAHRQRKYFHLEVSYLLNHGWGLYGAPMCDSDGYLCQAMINIDLDHAADPTMEGWRVFIPKPESPGPAAPYNEATKAKYDQMREECHKAP